MCRDVTLGGPHRPVGVSTRLVALAALVTLLTLTALALTPGRSAAATTTPSVLGRWDFLDGSSATDAAQFKYMNLGYGTTSSSQLAVRSMIASIHSSDPSTKIMLYKTIYTSPGDTTGINDCVSWNTSKPYGGVPLSWFLLGSNGLPLYTSAYGGSYWLDPGNSQVQQACLSKAVTMAKTGGFDGVFFDMMSTSLYWANLSASNCSSTSCKSDANWQHAIESYITAVSAGLHAQGLLAVGNISGGEVNGQAGGGSAYWQAYQLAGLDGAMEESFAIGTNRLPMWLGYWKQELANEVWNEANGKILIANGDAFSNQALNTYGLATMLLGENGHSVWNSSSGNYNNGEYIFPSYSTAQNLGAPLGAYTVQANGLYVRHFQNGSVVVNPTTGTINDPFYGSVAHNTGLIF